MTEMPCIACNVCGCVIALGRWGKMDWGVPLVRGDKEAGFRMQVADRTVVLAKQADAHLCQSCLEGIMTTGQPWRMPDGPRG
jgi:hypothetical protein